MNFVITLFIGFLPYNKKPLYCTLLLVYEQKQLTSQQKASVLKRTYPILMNKKDGPFLITAYEASIYAPIL